MCSTTSGMSCLSNTCVRSELLLPVGDHTKAWLTRFHFLSTVGPLSSSFPQIVSLSPALSLDFFTSPTGCTVKSNLTWVKTSISVEEGWPGQEQGPQENLRRKWRSRGHDLQTVMKAVVFWEQKGKQPWPSLHLENSSIARKKCREEPLPRLAS